MEAHRAESEADGHRNPAFDSTLCHDETTREVWGWTWMDRLLQDLRNSPPGRSEPQTDPSSVAGKILAKQKDARATTAQLRSPSTIHSGTRGGPDEQAHPVVNRNLVARVSSNGVTD
jgi:hypothetical protein